MKKRVMNAIAALCLATAALGAQSPQNVTLAIGYIPHVQFTPLYVGMEKGFYKDEGIRLDITYGFGIDIFSLLQNGKIDLGLSDSDQLILSGAKDMGLQAVFQYYQKYPVSIVAKADRIKDPKDLVGRRIGTPELYGTSYIGLQLFLRKFALVDKVQVERIGYTQESSLIGDKVDAVVCFSNNEPILLRQKGIAVSEWRVRDFSDIAGASFITSKDISFRKADALARFARATSRAIAYTAANREEALRIAIGKIGNIQPSDEPFFRLVLDATCDLFQSPGGYGFIDPTVYEHSISGLFSLGLIGAEFPAAKIINPLVK